MSGGTGRADVPLRLASRLRSLFRFVVSRGGSGVSFVTELSVGRAMELFRRSEISSPCFNFFLTRFDRYRGKWFPDSDRFLGDSSGITSRLVSFNCISL